MINDTTINFGVANVSTLYSANVGVIDLSNNHGLKLPPANKPFYAIWWNFTDYPDPTDDPDKEVVKVYRKVNDKLFIQRGCENTLPSGKNLVGKTYRIAAFFDEDKFNKQLNYFKNPSLKGHYFNDFEHSISISGTTTFDSFIGGGTSSGTLISTAAIKNKVGVVSVYTGNTGSASNIRLLSNTALLVVGSYDMEITNWVSFDFPSGTGGRSFRFLSGFLNSTTTAELAAPINCIGFFHDTTRSNWTFFIRNNSVTTLFDRLPVKVNPNIWYELKIKIYKRNYCEVFINKTLIKSYSNVLPMNRTLSAGLGIGQNVGTGTFNWDAFEFKANFLNERTASLLNS